MEIYLVRHTKPLVAEGICYGQTDLELADSFEKEAQAVIHELPAPFDVVYSSPLKRCLKLAQKLKPDCTVSRLIMELDFGDWEMQAWDAIPEKELNRWMNDYLNVPPPNGESATQLMSRVTAFYENLLTTKAEKVIIVSHLGAIRCFYALLNQVTLEASFQTFNLSYGHCYSKIV